MLQWMDDKMDEYGTCERYDAVPSMAQALLAMDAHPSRHPEPGYQPTFTACFSWVLGPELERADLEPRYERCLDTLRKRFAAEPPATMRELFERAINGLGTGVQAPARPRLLALLELTTAQIAPKKRPKGPATTLTVRYRAEVLVSSDDDEKELEGDALARFDGCKPDGDSYISEAPALDDVPAREDTEELVLRYDATTKSLWCDLVMRLSRPLEEDELEELRTDTLEQLDAGFDNPDWATPAPPANHRYCVVVSFVPTSIEQVPTAGAKKAAKPGAGEESAATKKAAAKQAAPRKPATTAPKKPAAKKPAARKPAANKAANKAVKSAAKKPKTPVKKAAKKRR